MCLIDVGPWNFEFRHESAIDRALGRASVERLEFADAADMLKHLAKDNDNSRVRFQRVLQDRLKQNQQCRSWTSSRGKISDLKHFAKYRRRVYDLYHGAAKAVAEGCESRDQATMVAGLTAEIEASKIILQAGQQLFHGRSEAFPAAPACYVSFISTSLDPVVSVNHSFKRPGSDRRPQVYILTARMDIPAIWGHTKSSVEWELLLPPGLVIEERSRASAGVFDVVEADVVGRRKLP